MEEVIRKAIKKFGFNKIENGKGQKVFTNLDGTLKDDKGNTLSKTEEAKIRTWHNIDKNEPIYIVFYGTALKKGDGFFVADRAYYFSTCIREEGISFAGIIQTDGWDKEDDGFLSFSWEAIEDITFVRSLDITIENSVPNAYFIGNDPAFTVFDKPHCVVFHSIEDNSYINIPTIYIAYDIVSYNNINIIDFFKEILSNYQVFSEKSNEYFSALGEELKSLKDNGEYQKLANKIEEVKEEIFFWVYYYYKIISLLQLDNTSEAYRLFAEFKVLFEKADKKTENYNAFLRFYTLTEAEICKKKGELYNAAYRYDKLKNLEEENNIPDTNAISYFEKDKKDAYNSFLSKFTEIDYNDRKVITISKTESLFKSDHITLLQMNNLPTVNFPITHPKQDHTYVCHPYKKNTYLPIEDYDYELLNDRINEYCYLLQCLGATSISIENTKGESNDSNTHSNTQINVEGSIRVHSGKVNSEQDKKARDYSKSMLKIGREQHFNPIKPPFVPDGLIWFPNEVGWQRLVQQRMEGNILNHSEYMSSTEHKILSNSEISDINGELKILFATIKGGRKKETEQQIETNQEIEWRINVEFKPIESFTSTNNVVEMSEYHSYEEVTEESKNIKDIETQQISNSENEKQFIEELQILFIDGYINEKERSMLDEMCRMLSISSERAQQLENEVIASLVEKITVNEKKYMQKVRAFLKEIGQIGHNERISLEKTREILVLTSQRASILEMAVFQETKVQQLTKEEEEYLEKVKTFVTDGIISERERRILIRLANLLGIKESRAIELEKQI